MQKTPHTLNLTLSLAYPYPNPDPKRETFFRGDFFLTPIKELRFIDVINSIISLKWLCQNLTPENFHLLNTCLFSKLN